MNDSIENFVRIAWTHAWQLTSLILLVSLVVWLVGKPRPHLATVLWLLVIFKCLMPPVWSSTSGVFCWLQPASGTSAAPSESRDNRSTAAETVVVQASPAEQATFPDPASATRNSLASNPQSERSWPLPWKITLCLAWLGGLLGYSLLTAVRWNRCWRAIQAEQVPPPAELSQLLARLQQKLDVRRPVRLIITSSDIGPAVVGLWRPTIVLPQAVVAGRDPRGLEPLLAHELLHIRRGDLWVALLQLLAQGVWWFHPLVHWASRGLTSDTERSCDEEVIARLGCQPASYARTLLAVLELKHQLHPVPAFPGVRPVDVTRQRLERIMKMGQGSRRSTPWWCWVVLASLAILLLPGAALLVPAKEKPDTSTAPRLESTLVTAFMDSTTSPPAAEGELSDFTYDVKDLLAKLQKEDAGASAESTRLYLTDMLRWLLPNAEKPQNERVLGWHDEQLVVRTTKAGHQRVAEQLAIFRESGFHQYVMEIRLVRAPAELQSAFRSKWETIQSPEAESFDAWLAAAEDASDKNQNRFESVIQRQPPALLTITNDAQVKDFMVKCQGDKRTSILSAPKVTTLNGQYCRVESASYRPFVVGLKPAEGGATEPRIRVVEAGWKLRLRAAGQASGKVKLDFALAQTEVRKVDVVEYPLGIVQVPEVAESRLHTAVTIEPGESIVLRGLESTGEEGKKVEPLWVLVRVAKIDER